MYDADGNVTDDAEQAVQIEIIQTDIDGAVRHTIQVRDEEEA